MGMSLIGSSSRCETNTLQQGDPDPKKFEILRIFAFNRGMLIVVVHYPGCTTFEGNKILVTKDIREQDIHDLKALDPHFKKDGFIVARFPYSQKGYSMAHTLINALEMEKE